MLRRVFCIHLHLCGLTLHNALVAVTLRTARYPVRAVGAYAQEGLIVINNKPVPSRSLDNLRASLVGIEAAHRIFKVVPGLHSEVLSLGRVYALLTSP